jgi:hypothetical protein
MSESFTPTFNAIIEPHPIPVITIPDDNEDETPPTPLTPYRQNATMDTPEDQGIAKRPPRRPIKPDPSNPGLFEDRPSKCKVHFDDELPPVCQPTHDVETILYGLAASFAVGAVVGTLLSLAFSRRVLVEE